MHPVDVSIGGEIDVGDVDRVLAFGHVADQPPEGSEPQFADPALCGDRPPAPCSQSAPLSGVFTAVVKAGRLDN